MNETERMPLEKRMRLRFAGTCRMCGREIAAGEVAIYERATKTVRCETCVPVPVTSTGPERVTTAAAADVTITSHPSTPDGATRQSPSAGSEGRTSAANPGDRRMRLRYAGPCRVCGREIAAGEPAIYEGASKTVRCEGCPPEVGTGGIPTIPVLSVSRVSSRPATTARRAEDHGAPASVDADGRLHPMSEWHASGSPEETEDEPQPEIESGHAGASARREYERRRARDEARTRKKWGILGGIAVALSAEKQSTKAWETGAVGEERLGRRLDDAASDDLMVLHDRRRPGTRMNIDHLAVTAEGVWVIDAKRYHGRPERKVTGGVLRSRAEHLVVGTRDCTDLVEAMHGQMQVVGEVVGRDVPITGVLCFVNADWPLVGGAFTVRGVEVLWPKKLVADLRGRSDGPHDIEAVIRRLAGHFPEA